MKNISLVIYFVFSALVLVGCDSSSSVIVDATHPDNVKRAVSDDEVLAPGECSVPATFPGSGELGFYVCDNQDYFTNTNIKVRSLIDNSTLINENGKIVDIYGNACDQFKLNWATRLLPTTGSATACLSVLDSWPDLSPYVTYLIYTHNDRFLARWQAINASSGTSRDVWGVVRNGIFEIDNTDDVTGVIENNVPALNQYKRCTGKVKGFEYTDNMFVEMVNGDAACQAVGYPNGECEIDLQPFSNLKTDVESYPEVGDVINMVVDLTGNTCHGKLYDWR